jgi:hypothetical protein
LPIAGKRIYARASVESTQQHNNTTTQQHNNTTLFNAYSTPMSVNVMITAKQNADLEKLNQITLHFDT